MKYLIPILFLLSACGQSHDCANSKLLGLWYINATGAPNYWFYDTCDVLLNGCPGFQYKDDGSAVTITGDVDSNNIFCVAARHVPQTAIPPMPYTLNPDGTLTLGGQTFFHYNR